MRRNDAQLALTQEMPERRLSRDVRLHGFLAARVEEMQAAIQQTAISDFNIWLVRLWQICINRRLFLSSLLGNMAFSIGNPPLQSITCPSASTAKYMNRKEKGSHPDDAVSKR